MTAGGKGGLSFDQTSGLLLEEIFFQNLFFFSKISYKDINLARWKTYFQNFKFYLILLLEFFSRMTFNSDKIFFLFL